MSSGENILIGYITLLAIAAWVSFVDARDDDSADLDAPWRHFSTYFIIISVVAVALYFSAPFEVAGAAIGMWVSISAVVYIFPWLIAIWRGHHNTLAIFALTILLGWTFLGWVAAIVWACTRVQRERLQTLEPFANANTNTNTNSEQQESRSASDPEPHEDRKRVFPSFSFFLLCLAAGAIGIMVAFMKT
jgi:hypothetical protein